MKKNSVLVFSFIVFSLFSCRTTQDMEKKLIKENKEGEKESVVYVQEDRNCVDIEPVVVESTKYVVISDSLYNEKKKLTGKDAVTQSLKDSFVKLEDFVGGTSFYDYDENRQFPIFTKQLSLTTIILSEDEYMEEGTLPIMSDTTRWQIIGNVWKSPEGERQLVLIKPTAPNLETNMLIVTNKRLYHFVLYSTSKDYQPTVRFRYPKEPEFQYKASRKNEITVDNHIITDITDPSLISFNYKINFPSSKKIDWIPELVYDDGSRTYIVLPEVTLQKDFPSIWENNKELTNYIVDGNKHNLIIVNKLIDKLTLRIGYDKVTIVKKKGEAKSIMGE